MFLYISRFCNGLRVSQTPLQIVKIKCLICLIHKHQPASLLLKHRLTLPDTALCWPGPACLWTSRVPSEPGLLLVPRCHFGWPPVLPCCRVQQHNWPLFWDTSCRAVGWVSYGRLPRKLHWETRQKRVEHLLQTKRDGHGVWWVQWCTENWRGYSYQ